MRRFHFAWPRESSHSCRIIHVFVARRCPLSSLFIPMCCRAIRVAFTSRCDSIITRRSTSALIKLCVIFHRAVRRGFDRSPAPCSFVTSFTRVDSPAASFEILLLCCSWLAKHNKKRGPPLAFRRLPSTSLGGGECVGYLLVLATVPRCRELHILIDAKSPIYILLLNIFSARVTLVTVRTLFYFYFLDNIKNFIVYLINSWYLSPRKTLLEKNTNFFARRWLFLKIAKSYLNDIFIYNFKF